MWARGGAQGRQTRAFVAIVAVALLSAVATAVAMAPGAVGQPSPPPSRHASGAGSSSAPVFRLGHRAPVEVGQARAPSPDAARAEPASFAPAVPGAGFATAPTTEAQVATDLIGAVDARSNGGWTIVATPDNVALLVTWMNNEGGLWADNPLNTSLDAARYPDQFTTAGVDTGIPIFPDIQAGIDATAVTLLSGQAYVGILGVLSMGTATCETFARAVIASPWAASHYGGVASRFCGAPATPGTVPVTTACPRRPHRGGRRLNTPTPAACERPGLHSGRSRGARRRSPTPVVAGRPRSSPDRSSGVPRHTPTPPRPTARPVRVAINRSGDVRRGRR